MFLPVLAGYRQTPAGSKSSAMRSLALGTHSTGMAVTPRFAATARSRSTMRERRGSLATESSHMLIW